MQASRAGVEAHIRATPVTGTPAERRAAFEALAGPGPEGTRLTLGGVPCRAFGTGAPVIWLHGGGYVFGSGQSHAKCGSVLAELAAMQVIVPDYRLAPEYPWPAPFEDALAVVRAVGCDVPLVGDSAGGHLALVLAQGPARPRRLGLISPNTDRTGRSTTRAQNSGSDLMNDDDTDAELARMAFGDRAPEDPVVSPLLGDLSRLPPTYLAASRAEVLADDTRLLHAAAVGQGADVTLEWQADLFHMWTLWPEALPEARATLAAIARHLTA